jgi:hypothetical protein
MLLCEERDGLVLTLEHFTANLSPAGDDRVYRLSALRPREAAFEDDGTDRIRQLIYRQVANRQLGVHLVPADG